MREVPDFGAFADGDVVVDDGGGVDEGAGKNLGQSPISLRGKWLRPCFSGERCNTPFLGFNGLLAELQYPQYF